MEITEKQKHRLQRYMREVSAHLSDLPEAERRGAVGRLRAQLEQGLQQSGDGELHDSDIDALLASCGAPADQAALLVEHGGYAPVAGQTGGQVWLGVCARLARGMDADPLILRVILVVLGLVFPLLPLLLTAYMGAYFWMRYIADQKGLRPIRWVALVKGLAITFGISLALYLGTGYTMILAQRLIWRFLEQSIVLEPKWGWLEIEQGRLFFWALYLLLPLTALSAMPVKDAWAGTLRKVVHAALALYALALCFGLASFAAGAVLYLAQNFRGASTLTGLF